MDKKDQDYFTVLELPFTKPDIEPCADHHPAETRHYISNVSNIRYRVEGKTSDEQCRQFDEVLVSHPNFHILKGILSSDVQIVFSDYNYKEINPNAQKAPVASGSIDGITFFSNVFDSVKMDEIPSHVFHEAGHLFAFRKFGDVSPIPEETYEEIQDKHKGRRYISGGNKDKKKNIRIGKVIFLH